jgi:hypothetical protein
METHIALASNHMISSTGSESYINLEALGTIQFEVELQMQRWI